MLVIAHGLRDEVRPDDLIIMIMKMIVLVIAHGLRGEVRQDDLVYICIRKGLGYTSTKHKARNG